MRLMKFTFTLLTYVFISSIVQAQTEEDKTVTLTVSGTGQTQNEAKERALRNAIEQAFGAFISSKTEILNDKIISDQITSVANGNIQSYELLSESQIPTGGVAMTLKAVVSVNKLTSFVQSKGISVEIKGGLFAMNVKQQLLNEQGEIKAVSEMLGLLHEPLQISFDYDIKSSDPKSVDSESKNWEIPLTVTATSNKNIDFCANYLKNTLNALTLSASEVETYNSLNKPVFRVKVNFNGESTVYYLRKQKSISMINSLLRNWGFYTRLFVVQSGMDETSGTDICRKFYSRSTISDEEIGKDIQRKAYIEKINDILIESDFMGSSDWEISLPKSGQNAATFSWSDVRALSQIEQMSAYNVNPKGIVSNFKNGGYVVYEKDGHGLVVDLCDIGELNWSEAKITCDALYQNGYNDWYLPSMDELKLIYNFTESFNCWFGFFGQYYWTSSKNNEGIPWHIYFRDGSIETRGWNEFNELSVRPIRAF